MTCGGGMGGTECGATAGLEGDIDPDASAVAYAPTSLADSGGYESAPSIGIVPLVAPLSIGAPGL